MSKSTERQYKGKHMEEGVAYIKYNHRQNTLIVFGSGKKEDLVKTGKQ